ncbi:unnamed protein product [Rotaria sp. Silwood2]|nr:unnamed protein product [Rotaria sp. Silwood2]
MLYPFAKNNEQLRTHDDFVQAAQAAAAEHNHTGRETIIDGVRGFSPLLCIIKYPVSVLYDYMHLVCINHIGMLVKHWLLLLNSTDISLIDERLLNQRVPHNMNIRFDFSIKEISQWKAKHGRLFVLYVGLPILINILSSTHLFHFAAYVVAIRFLHAPENETEIDLAEKLLRFYCDSSSLIYGPSVELYSLHCHLHLAEQVRYHGGLSYSSAFAFESCIRYTKKKAHGTRNIASQISYWTDVALLIKQPKFDVEIPHGVDEISIDSPQLGEFREMLTDFIQFDKVKFYKRFKIPFITFHSTLYDNKFKCVSHIISYKHDQDDKIRFGDCIIFIQCNNDYYAFINNYRDEAPNNSLSSLLKISDTATCQIIEPLDRLYSVKSKSDSFEILSMSKVRHKCISVPVGDFFCLTEIRNDFEHD